MKIALVGPGVMSIPPPGWGAVEILLHEYYTVLKQEGQEVDLINIIRSNPNDSQPNTDYTRHLIDTINNKEYDFVHIHYDILYHIIPHLRCKTIAITSHYPYIDQFERHPYDWFDGIFKGICESKAFIFALSEKDKAAFIKGGVKEDRLFLSVNGSNENEIIPSIYGSNQYRSVCIGRVQPRKRQSAISSIAEIDFYGPCDDTAFRSLAGYKGEVSHSELMKILPTYDNLVLLSDGENGTPLVIKEALMAGMPVVVSEHCINDIDVTLPFIDVISENKVYDIDYVNHIITENRKKKIQYTEQIRQYALQHFSWSALLKKYIATIDKLVVSQQLLPLSIAIIGPGYMPIPPTGWGACEILIWNYACELRKAGHTVEIINTTDTDEIVRIISEMKPDFVHVQFDDYGHIAKFIHMHCRAIAITSHYAYLEQPDKWHKYYGTMFYHLICHTYPNVFHFVLSDGIANVYKEHGVDPSKLFIVPNGADAELFRYTDQPAYAERSIVVGKIESRKGQYLIQDNQSVWFAGNKGEDDSFDYSNPRWLGEWNKDTLYHNLTDYGNLVLLSDGEADSLVIKEALVAGLGVVVSQWGAANIDAALPFITAIPNDKLQDCAYVDEKIKANREISVTMRSTIREYSKKFHWSTRVADYLNIVKRIL